MNGYEPVADVLCVRCAIEEEASDERGPSVRRGSVQSRCRRVGRFGPFVSKEGAMVASDNLAAKGYNTEICRLSNVEDVLAPSACDRGE
jgi:hypothetical protein